MKKLYLGRDKKICGLCAGIGNYFDIDPTLIRIAVLTFTLLTIVLPMIMIYFILALVFPQAPDEYVETNTGKILTKGEDKRVAGVCSGYAAYFNLDPTVVRLIFAILVLFIGGGFLLYLVSMLLMPSFHTPREYRGV